MSVSDVELRYYREVFLLALADGSATPADALTVGVEAVVNAVRYGQRAHRIPYGVRDNVAEVFDAVQAKYQVTRAQLTGQSRVAAIARAREELYVRLHALGLSYPAVGRLVGGRHHTTIMSGVTAHHRRVEALADIEMRIEASLEGEAA